jgi:predicted peptidase
MLTQECIDHACGLVVDVHGWLSNPDEQEGRSNLAWAAMENGGYIVVQPGELSKPSSWNPEIHYAVVFEFMQQAMDAFDVDRDRVHFSGFSQGGYMTWKFICDHPDIIASAAPISATETHCFRTGTGPSRKVPILFVSGTKDILIPYYITDNAWSVNETLVSVMYDYDMVTVDADAYLFSEGGDIVVDETGRINIADENVQFEIVNGSEDNSYLWTRYTSPDNIAFEHLRHDNGHVYPDNPDSLIFPEEPTVWFSVGEAVLRFFAQNPRK